MNFSEALEALKKGQFLQRSGWNGKGMWIHLQRPDENSKMTRPYIYMILPPGSTNQFGDDDDKKQLVPWLPSQTDLLSEDWEVCSTFTNK